MAKRGSPEPEMCFAGTRLRGLSVVENDCFRQEGGERNTRELGDGAVNLSGFRAPGGLQVDWEQMTELDFALVALPGLAVARSAQNVN